MPAQKFVLLVAIIGLAGEAAAQTQFLAELVGEWRGRGTLRASPTADMVRGACRFDIVAGDAAEALRIDGACASASRTATLAMAVTGCGGLCVAATGTTSELPDPFAYRGARRDNALELRSTGLIDASGGVYRSELSFVWRDGAAFDLVERFEDMRSGERIDVVRMTFTRRDDGG